ncbi:hypothetical protein MRX96_004566 [Rhipicephalus microplus]
MGPPSAAERRKRPLSGRSGKRNASRPTRLCYPLSHWPAGCIKSVRQVGEGRSVRHRLAATVPLRAARDRRRPSRNGRYAQHTTGERRGVRSPVHCRQLASRRQ